MRKIGFCNDVVYHVYNRGVEKRKIFLDNKDYYRFIHDLYEFNDEESAEHIYYRSSSEIGSRKYKKNIVEILIFCLMPNHFHLLVKQKRESGISNFMHKLGVGYTMYFNKKYERVGGLFQGRFKATSVEKENHFIHLPYYIHLNPIELIEPNWKEKQIKNIDNTIEFIESYRWSSYLDYIGKKNFPSVIQKNFMSSIFGEPENYRKTTIEWLNDLNLKEIKPLLLE